MASIRSLLLLVAISIDRALSQTCAPGGIVGACLYLVPGDMTTAMCPPGNRCLINLPRPVCCVDAFILLPTLPTDPPTTVTTTTPTTTTTTTTAAPAADDTCFDLLNPVTGASDCAAKRALCSDRTYYEVMSVQCAATCGFCSSTPSAPTGPTCADQVDPATCSVERTDCRGCRVTTSTTCKSACSKMASYCEMPAYKSLMAAQCPQTCGLCKYRKPSVAPPTGCVDLLNPATGYSDCRQKSALCRESRYSHVMAVQCPRTCGLCPTLNADDLSLKLRAFRSKFYPPFTHFLG